MEKGISYKVEAFYDNYCVVDSNDKVRFLTEGNLHDQLEKIKHDYKLYKFINKDVRISDELTAKYVIFFNYGKFVIIA